MILPEGGGQRQVIQLHTENWPDMEAPEDPRKAFADQIQSNAHCTPTPRVLVDLAFRVHDLLQHTPGIQSSVLDTTAVLTQGCLLVHCSAGVGRTGTFLALYKLWLDYMVQKGE